MAIVAAGIIVALITLLVLIFPVIIRNAIGIILYGIAKGLFYICDFLQLCFRRLAGLDTHWVKGNSGVIGESEEKTGDILISLFSSKTVIEALIAMTLFAVALLLIVTIVQIIRVEYTTEGSKNSKGTILGKAIKSFAMFILVPVVCFLGIFTSNKILFALDAATAQAGTSTLSGSIFLAGAADANVIRNGNSKTTPNAESVGNGVFYKWTNDETAKANLSENGDSVVGFDGILKSNRSTSEGRQEDLATKIDNIFVLKYSRFAGEANQSVLTVEKINNTTIDFIKLKKSDYVHYTNTDAVQYFYDFFKMNFFILYVGTAFVLMSLLKASVGLIMRLYKATALFIISPAVTALTPLDDGNAYKSWRKSFIGSVLGAYGYVVALNLLFLLMGVIDNIYIFPTGIKYAAANAMVQALMVIVGVNMLSDLTGLIAGFIGAEDVLKTGEGMSKKVTDSVGKIGSFAVKGTMGAVGGFAGVAARIDSGKANKSQRLRDNLEEANKSGDTDKIKKAQNALNKYNSSGNVEEKEEKYRLRAAINTRRYVRGKEMASDLVQGSAVGSFLNNATGKMFATFGGKGMKNLDDKVSKEAPDAFKLAEGKSFVDKVGGAIGTASSFVYSLGAERGEEKTPAKAFGANNDSYEENLKIAKTVGSSKVLGYYEGQGNHNDYESYLAAKGNNVTNTYDNFVKSFNNGDMTKAELLTKLGEFAKSFEPGTQSSGNLNSLITQIKSSRSDNDVKNILDASLKGVPQFTANDLSIKTSGGNITLGDYEKSSNFDGDEISYYAHNYERDIKRKGHAYAKDFAAMAQTYDDKKAATQTVNNTNQTTGSGANTGQGGEGQGNDQSNAGNFTFNNATVKMEQSKTTIEGKTEIKDSNAIANQTTMTVKEAMKAMEEKEEARKNDKQQKIIDMLTKMSSTLGDIKKNTKK